MGKGGDKGRRKKKEEGEMEKGRIKGKERRKDREMEKGRERNEERKRQK